MSSGEPGREGGRWRTVLTVLVFLGLATLAWIAPRRGWLASGSQPQVVVLYAFSALDDVLRDRLLPAFRERWQSERGEKVEFVATFAGSGEITERILSKVPAELAIVSSELDAYRLPAAPRAWRDLPHGGVLARTPLVLVVRVGNPKGIRDWADLARPGIEVVHGDPTTSGAAELAVLAEYASVMRRGGDAGAASRQLLGIWRSVVAQPPTARQARHRFEAGVGDALVTYAADVVGSPSRSKLAGEVVVPRSTIAAEPVVVRVDKNIGERQGELCEAFVEFLWTLEVQRILVDYGFESVLPEVAAARDDLPSVADPFTLADLGGVTARREILERVWRDAVVPELRR